MKYTPGLLAGQLSGAAGSTVASHNRYASYFRTRTIPTNPLSARQLVVRQFFGANSQDWRNLTESQRVAWSDLALSVPVINAQGNPVILAGNAFFQKINIQRSTIGFAPLTDAPALDSPPNLTSMSAVATVAAGGTMELTYVPVGGVAGNRFLVRATATRSPGITYTSPADLRVIGLFAGNAASPFDTQAAYEAIFGVGWLAQAGMEIAFAVNGVSINGFALGPIHAVALIA